MSNTPSFGKFTIKSCLASVASGQLFTGNKTNLAQPKEKDHGGPAYVVLKESSLDRIFSKKPKDWDAAVAELQQLKHFHHPFIANSYNAWQEKGVLYYEREYLDGASMEATIESRHGQPFVEIHILDWLSQMILALKYLHYKKLIHRNLKANNVFFVVGTDSQTIVKITDMMTEKIFDESRALMANSAMGGGLAVAGHFAPELISANVKERTTADLARKQATTSYDAKIDIWALGVVLYQLMSFKHPFASREGEPWERIVLSIRSAKREPIPPDFLNNYSKGLVATLDTLFAIDPNKRPTIKQLADDIALTRMLVLMLHFSQIGNVAKIKQIANMVENDMKVLAGKEVQSQHEESSETERKMAGDTPLHKAARSNQVEAVVTLLDYGVPVDLLNDDGDTPLHCCATAETAQVLLERGAKIDARGQQGRTALHFAVEREHLDLIELLLEKVAKNELIHYLEAKEDQMGATALSLAAWIGSVEAAEALIKRGANVQARDNDLDTPLHTAAFEGQVKVAELLLQRGAQLEAKNKPDLGRTALHTAAENGRVEVVKLFISHHANLNAVDMQTGSTPLHLACQFGHQEIVHALLAAGADKEATDTTGDRPIHRAAACGFAGVVFELLSSGANGDACDAHNRTPLIIAASEGHASVVETLVKSGGVDLEARDDEFGNMAIHVASALGYDDIVKILLEKDGTIANRINDARRSKGRTALHLAVLHGRVKVADLILSSSTTDPTRKDTLGKTAYLLMKHDMMENKEIDNETKEAMARLFRRVNVRN